MRPGRPARDASTTTPGRRRRPAGRASAHRLRCDERHVAIEDQDVARSRERRLGLLDRMAGALLLGLDGDLRVAAGDAASTCSRPLPTTMTRAWRRAQRRGRAGAAASAGWRSGAAPCACRSSCACPARRRGSRRRNGAAGHARPNGTTIFQAPVGLAGRKEPDCGREARSYRWRQDSRNEIGRSSQRSVCRTGGSLGPAGRSVRSAGTGLARRYTGSNAGDSGTLSGVVTRERPGRWPPCAAARPCYGPSPAAGA